MSVVNEFNARIVKVNEVDKVVYLTGDGTMNGILHYHIACKTQRQLGSNIMFFFNLQTKKMLTVSKAFDGQYICSIMAFWLDNNKPVSSANWLINQNNLMNAISEQFQDQYASYLIDEAINA